MLFCRKKSLILSSLIIFFIIFSFNINCFSSELTGTDEVELFSAKAKEIIESLNNKKIAESKELMDDVNYKLNTFKIISLFTKAIAHLEKSEFDQVLSSIKEAEDIINSIKKSGKQIKLTDYKIIYLGENRVKVEVKLYNDSEDMLKNYKFKANLLDKDGNVIDSNFYYLSKDFIRSQENINMNCYFYNIVEPEKVVKVEFEL